VSSSKRRRATAPAKGDTRRELMRFFVRSTQGGTAEGLRLRDAILAAVKVTRRGGMAIVGDGDPSGDDDLIEAHAYWRRRYGDKRWAPLRADDVHRLLVEIVQPGELGLEPIRRGWFGRRVGSDIVQLLHFAPAKGYSYGIHWGVSLAFVPHEFQRRIRFHRTLRSAHLDLFENSAEEFRRRGGNERDGFIAAGYGADVFRRDATAAWDFVRPRVEEWWASTATVEGVLAHAREQIAATAVPRHWPDPALVAPFALARLRRGDEARSALDEWLAARAELESSVATSLFGALEKVQPA
jgi:hypothetical protein